MLRDVDVDTLSKVEVYALQRLAVNQLQAMEIPVSHGILKGTSFTIPLWVSVAHRGG